MKILYRNIDKETMFCEDEIEKARYYFSVDGENYEDCQSLEELAEEWNANNAGNAIGELVIKEI